MSLKKIVFLSFGLLTTTLTSFSMHRSIYKKTNTKKCFPRKKVNKPRNLCEVTKDIKNKRTKPPFPSITSANLGKKIYKCTEAFIRFNRLYNKQPSKYICKLLTNIRNFILFDKKNYFLSHPIFEHCSHSVEKNCCVNNDLYAFNQMCINYAPVSLETNTEKRQDIAKKFKESLLLFMKCMGYYQTLQKRYASKKDGKKYEAIQKDIYNSLALLINDLKSKQ